MGEKRMLYGFDFERAIIAVGDGDKITRESWGDKRHYGFLKDHLLQLHKAGEAEDVCHPWILNEDDINADDWIIITEAEENE